MLRILFYTIVVKIFFVLTLAAPVLFSSLRPGCPFRAVTSAPQVFAIGAKITRKKCCQDFCTHAPVLRAVITACSFSRDLNPGGGNGWLTAVITGCPFSPLCVITVIFISNRDENALDRLLDHATGWFN